MSPLAELHAATLSRGGRELIAGLSLAVHRGDLVWVRGPNGSGKSTLLRAVAGLLPLEGGSISRREPAQSGVAFLASTSGFDPQATLQTEARTWLRARDHAALPEVLQTPIEKGRRVAELSAGQVRKMEILRTVGAERDLWLLDEPYASLDAEASARLSRTITGHLDRGGACMVASHAELPAFGREVRTVTIGAPA